MSLRRSPTRTVKSRAAKRAHPPDTAEPGPAQYLLTGQIRRDYKRLRGFSEALTLDLEPGAAIHLYHELIAPYEQVPPLRFTVTLLNTAGLADLSQPTPRRRHRKKPRGAPRQTWNVATGQRHSAIFEKTSLRGAPRVHKS